VPAKNKADSCVYWPGQENLKAACAGNPRALRETHSWDFQVEQNTTSSGRGAPHRVRLQPVESLRVGVEVTRTESERLHGPQ